MSSTTIRCDNPMPRVSRPSQASYVVSACCASAVGCRGCTGTTYVPTSMTVSEPVTAQAVRASRSKMWLNQAEAKPSSAALRTPSRARARLRPPTPIPMRTCACYGVCVVD